MDENKSIKKAFLQVENSCIRNGENTDNLCDSHKDKYFMYTYIDRNIEEEFESILENKFVLLTGRAGSGKTSLIKKVISNNLSYCNNDNKEIFYINFETLTFKTTHLKPDEIDEANFTDINSDFWFDNVLMNLFTKIENIYLNKNNDINYIDELISFLIVYKKDKDSNMSTYVLEIQNLLDSNNIKYSKISAEESDDLLYNRLLKIIKENKNLIFEKFNDFLLHIMKNKELYIFPLISFLYKKMQKQTMLIFDNVDIAPLSYQIKLYKEARIISTKLNTNNIHVKILISVREENALIYDHDDGSLVSKVFIISEIENDIFSDDPQTIYNVLDRKISYLLTNTNLSTERKYIAKIQHLNKKILESQFLIGNMYSYSNKSIRTSLIYTLNFLKWLLIENKFEYDQIKNLEHTVINSLFLGWAATANKEIEHIEGLDLSIVIKKMKDSHYREVGCDINFLILILLHNNKNELTFREISRKLKGLENESSFLKEAIFNMYKLTRGIHTTEEYGHIVSIPRDKRIDSKEDIDNSMIIYLYPKGDELIKLATSFTFTNSLFTKNNYDLDNYFEPSEFLVTIVDKIEKQYIFLLEIIEIHIIELYRICNRSLSVNWIHDYLTNFGYLNKFQVENIIRNNVFFFYNILKHINDIEIQNKIKSYINTFNVLSELYITEIAEMRNNINNNNIRMLDFRNYINENKKIYTSIDDKVGLRTLNKDLS